VTPEVNDDTQAISYLLGAAQEISRKQPLAIVVTISEEPESLESSCTTGGR
jgi:hypothetical protein